MVVYTDKNGVEHEMPELDASLYAKQNAVDKAQDVSARAKEAWAFLKAALGADALEDIFGTRDQRRASVPKVLTVYGEVRKAYWGEHDEARREEVERQIDALGSLPQLIEALAKVADL